MRVALVSTFYLPVVAGIETYTEGVAHELLRRGHEVLVVCLAENGAPTSEELLDGVRVRRVAHRDLGVSLQWPQRLLSPGGADIVHFQGFSRPLLAKVLRDAGGTPLVVTPHGGLRMVFSDHVRWRRVLKLAFDKTFSAALLRRTGAILCLTSEEVDYMEEYARVPSQRLKLLANPIPVDAETVYDDEQGASGRFLVLAREAVVKRTGDLLEALTRASDLPGCDIVGQPGDASEDLRLAGRALGDRARFHGPVMGEPKMAMLRRARALVLCSQAEGQSIAALEALSQGTPVVASLQAAMGLPEAGVVRFETGDVDALVSALRSASEPTTLAGLREGAESVRPHLLTTRAHIDSLVDTYQALLQ